MELRRAGPWPSLCCPVLCLLLLPLLLLLLLLPMATAPVSTNTVANFTCTFSSSICSTFQQASSDDAQWDIMTSASSGHSLYVPDKGHTEGSYAYPAFQDHQDGAVATLMTVPIATDAALSCLVFWYSMATGTTLGTLLVNVSAPDLSGARTVWSFSDGVTLALQNHWSRAAVTVNTSQPLRIIFSTHRTDGKGTVGLSDVELSKGHCLSEQEVVSTFSCDLDKEDVCGMGQDSLGDSFDWTWYSGPTMSDYTGPDKDHTTGAGHYLYMELSSPRKLGQKAVLSTPTVLPSFPRSCLTFYLHVYGSKLGSFSVHLGKSEFSNATSARLWATDQQISDNWEKVTVDFTSTEPYKIFFVATRGRDHTGDIGIDDIKIENRRCDEYPSASCSFDKNLCGFMQWGEDDFDWVHKRIERRSADYTGPTHSPHVSGSFMQVEVDGTQPPGKRALLLSALMTTLSSADSCLTFWYHLHGQSVGDLALMTADPLVNTTTTTVWSANSEAGDRWHRVAVTVSTSPPSRFLFSATVGKGRGDFAIDDVKVTIGACPYHRLVFGPFHCDLDRADVCGFHNHVGPEDSFDWLWHSGETPTGSLPYGPVTGPSSDHTSGKGHYMYIDSSPPRTLGSKARLVSPRLWLTSGQNCLTFWYSMSGSQIGQLSVSVMRADGVLIPLWNASEHQSAEWLRASVDINMRALVQVVFEGTVGEGRAGDMAIDDIDLQNHPCPVESVNCSFSEGGICGYRQSAQDTLDWTLTKGRDDPSSGQPSADNTTGTGLFLYQNDHRPASALVSPVLDWDVRHNCLQFHFCMLGSTMGSLAVSLGREGLLEERIPLWTTAGEKPAPPEWKSVSLNFELYFPLQIIFEVVRGPGIYSDIAIDNVKVLPHQCGGYDNPLTCDFSADSCQYVSMALNSTDNTWVNNSGHWKRQQGGTPTPDTGPLADHTTGKNGSYMYEEGGSSSLSPVLLASEVVSNVTQSCLAFWYMMHGAQVGPFTVFAASAENATVDRRDLWRRSEPTQRLWTLQEVDVNVLGSARIYFEATKDTAVDDIALRRQPCGPTPLRESPADCTFDNGFCGYKPLHSGTPLHPAWIRTNESTPTANTGPSGDSPPGYAGHYVYFDASQITGLNGSLSKLESPLLSWSPQKICLRFAYHMQGKETGRLTVGAVEAGSGQEKLLWTVSGDQGQGWQLAEVDVDLPAPAFFRFVAVSYISENMTLYSNIGLDDVTVTSGTCNPVPWTEGMAFRCDRPTTACVSGQCHSATRTCDCQNGFTGLQCQVPAGPLCTQSPCERGRCFNDSSCLCPDLYYGDRCQHQMVHAECTDRKMTVNILPPGFTDLAAWSIRYPETAGGTACMLKPVKEVTGVENRGWQGFAGEFLHENDPCAGSATLLTETANMKTFSRQLHVYFDPLGRHLTDSNVTVQCDVVKPTIPPPPLPPPRLSMVVKELGRRRPLPPRPLQGPRRRIRTDVEIFFSINIPNRRRMTEIKVMQCTAGNGVKTIFVVKNGCALYPVGRMLYDGRRMGTEFLLMQVYKFPRAPLSVHFKCLVRLCDSAMDYFCYRRTLCSSRMKRSAPSGLEERMRGENVMEVEYTYTFLP